MRKAAWSHWNRCSAAVADCLIHARVATDLPHAVHPVIQVWLAGMVEQRAEAERQQHVAAAGVEQVVLQNRVPETCIASCFFCTMRECACSSSMVAVCDIVEQSILWVRLPSPSVIQILLARYWYAMSSLHEGASCNVACRSHPCMASCTACLTLCMLHAHLCKRPFVHVMEDVTSPLPRPSHCVSYTSAGGADCCCMHCHCGRCRAFRLHPLARRLRGGVIFRKARIGESLTAKCSFGTPHT